MATSTTNYFSYILSGGVQISGPNTYRLDADFCHTDDPLPFLVSGTADATWWDYSQPTGLVSFDSLSTWTIYQEGSSGGGGGPGPDDGATTVTITSGFGVNATPTSYWYRVESVCGPLTCPPFSMPSGTPPNDCNNMTMLVNILATSTADVCNQLTRRGLTLGIKSIMRQTLPAFRSAKAALAAAGVDVSCNPLVAVPVDQVPECLQLRVSQKPIVYVGVAVNATIISGLGMLSTGELRVIADPVDFTWICIGNYRVKRPRGSAEIVSSCFSYVGS